MENLTLNMIFLAHPAKFFCASVKKFTEEQGPQVYILDDYEDFGYLVDDLNPQVICVESNVYSKFRAGIEHSIGTKKIEIIELVASGKNPQAENFINLPVEASEFLNLVKSKFE